MVIGAKMLLMIGARMVTLQRDETPGLRYAGMWDLPGGGIEPGETAEACMIRELGEELGLTLTVDQLIWRRDYPSVDFAGRMGAFFAARLPVGAEARIVFGDEGQGWALMAPGDWLAHPLAVPHFRGRVRDGLTALGAL